MRWNRPLFSLWHLGLWLLLGVSLSCQPEKDSCLSSADCKTPALPVCFQRRCQAALCQSDTDCQDPSQPSCKNGLCQPKQASCTRDLDCKDLRLPRCVQGQCLPPPCTSQADCASSLPRCFEGFCRPLCSKDGDCTDLSTPLCRLGRCQPYASCQTSADCTEPAYPQCNAGRCQPRFGECQLHTDCPPNTAFCLDGQCQAHPFSCQQHKDCRVKEFPHCQNGACLPAPVSKGCLRDGDCTSPSAPRCREGVCGPLCLQHADCTAPQASCQQGRCSRCAHDLDCLPSELCYQGQCRASLPTFCAKDADCQRADALGASCLSGRCFRLHAFGPPIRRPHEEDGSFPLGGFTWNDSSFYASDASSFYVALSEFDQLPPVPSRYDAKQTCVLHAYTKAGQHRWSQRASTFLAAGSVYDIPCHVAQAPNGGLYWLANEVTTQPVLSLRRLSPDGRTEWERSFHGEGPPPPKMKEFPFQWSDVEWKAGVDGEMYLSFGEGWRKREWQELRFFRVGELILGSETQERPFVVKLTPQGTVAWLRFFPHPIKSTEVDLAGNLYLLGRTNSPTWQGRTLRQEGGIDLYVAKLSPQGDLVWVTTVGSPYLDCPSQLRWNPTSRTLGVLGALHVRSCPWVQEASDTSPEHTKTRFGGWNLEHPSSPRETVFFAQLSTQGEWIWALPLGDFSLDSSTKITPLSSGRWWLQHFSTWQEYSRYGRPFWQHSSPPVYEPSFPVHFLFFAPPGGTLFGTPVSPPSHLDQVFVPSISIDGVESTP